MEGSFDNDVLIGDGGKNAILGQPGEDRIYGNGGEDVLDARDGVRDAAIQCAPGAQIVKGAHLRGRLPGPCLRRPLRSASGELRGNDRSATRSRASARPSDHQPGR